MSQTSRIPAPPNRSFFAMNRWFYKMHQTGLLYNPDDLADDIVVIATGEALFSKEECKELDSAIKFMFELHGDKVYDVCLHYAQKPIIAKLTSV